MALPAMTANSPSAGSIAWAAFNIQYLGVSYAIAAGSTSQRFVWWRYNTGGSTTVVEAGPNVPQDLKDDDVLLFGNRNGVPVRMQSTSLVDGDLLVDGTIIGRHLAVDSVTTDKLASNSVSTAELAANAVTAAKLETLLALASKIVVGQFMTLDGEGLTVTHPNGRQTVVHADGSGTEVVGAATLDRATILGNLDIQGAVNRVSGLLEIPSGVTNPTDRPAAAAYWGDPSSYAQMTQDGAPLAALPGRGLGTWDADNWLYVEPTLREGGTVAYDNAFYSINKTTGQRTLLGTAANTDEYSHPYLVGSNVYVLARYNVAGSTYEHYLARLSASTFAKSATLTITPGTTNGASVARMAMTYDGTNLCVAHRQPGALRLRIDRWVPSTFADAGSATSDATVAGDFLSIVDLVVSAADTGATRIFAAAPNGDVLAWTAPSSWPVVADNAAGATLTRYTAGDFPRANSEAPAGLLWDGAKFVSAGAASARLWRHSTIKDSTALSVAYSLYDSNATGGEHETMPSLTLSLTPARRAPLRLSATADLTKGGTDDPDRIRFYVDGKRQPDLPLGALATVLSSVLTTGAAPQTSNGFSSVPGASGSIRTTKKDSAGDPVTRVDGDGSWRLGPVRGGADGRLAMDRCTVFLTAATTSYAGGAWVDQGASTVEADTNSMYSLVNGVARITIKKKGRYRVAARGRWTATSASNVRGIAIKRFNSAGSAQSDVDEAFAPSVASTQPTSITASSDHDGVELNAGDYITVQHRQQSGGALNIIGGQPHYTGFGVEAVEIYE